MPHRERRQQSAWPSDGALVLASRACDTGPTDVLPDPDDGGLREQLSAEEQCPRGMPWASRQARSSLGEDARGTSSDGHRRESISIGPNAVSMIS